MRGPDGVWVGVVDAASTRELRRSVLRPGLRPGDPLPGDDVVEGVHVGAVAGATVMGTCFVAPAPCPWRPEAARAWRLRQMATAPQYRGQGVGARVLAAALDLVRDRGGDLVWCHAREGAVEFYRRHGFRAHGELFPDDEVGIPHLDMAVDVSVDAAAEPDADATSS